MAQVRANEGAQVDMDADFVWLLQMKVLILAGYETTSSTSPCSPLRTRSQPLTFVCLITVSLTVCILPNSNLTRTLTNSPAQWALIELSRKPETQARLREELKEQFPASDPSWEQLTNGAGLHYLDAVVHEILRMHAPLASTTRVAAKDDVIPLANPIVTKSGQSISAIPVRKGQEVQCSIASYNR